MLTAWPFNDFKARLDAKSPSGTTAGERRLVLSGIPDAAACHVGSLISDVPLRPIWRGIVTDRLEVGRLSLPGLAPVDLYAAADSSRLEDAALHMEATDLALCCDSEHLTDLDRLAPLIRPLRRLAARGTRISVVIVGLGVPEQRYRHFLSILAAARATWPVYRVGRQDPMAARLTARMMLHAPLAGVPTTARPTQRAE